jgi:chemotaxis protein MotB
MNYRWQKKKARTHRPDDWLMTYADMITLLLCFFALFLSVSIPKKDVPRHINVPVPPPVVQPAKPPDFLEGNLPFHGLPVADEPTEDADEVIPAKPAEAAAPPVETQAPPANAPPASLPEIVDHLKTEGPAGIEQKGDRITTIEMNSAAFFGSGLANLSESGKAILQAMAINLSSDQFKDYRITVEGHTDDQPINTAQFPSNWELSTARASAVVHYSLQQGIPAQRLRAAGYADTFPIAPNRDANNKPVPENEARNRRVVIKLEKIDKAE